MSKKPFTNVLAILLTLTLVVSAVFFSAPQPVLASGASCMVGLVSAAASAFSSAASVPNNSLTEDVTTNMSAGATLGSCINSIILIPLAQAAIKTLLQSMTARIINFINGSNSTGQPSFVPNIAVNLQAVGDAVAEPFIGEISQGVFNSPFGSAIAESLQNSYVRGTDLAGFYAANQCTLDQSSPDINSYLAGNWSQGGVGSWLALTTESQNNPYMLDQAAQGQLGALVSQAQGNRQQDLLQSGGFLSWCGGGPPTYDPTTSTNSGFTPTSNGFTTSATCFNKDGSPGYVETPGSVISGYAQKAVVDAGFSQEYAQLISANQIDGALSAIVGDIFSQVMGGVNGLLGASQSSSSASPSLSTQLNNYSPDTTSVAAAATAMAQTVSNNVTSYTTAWDTIASAANNASTSAASLASFCTAAANTASTSLEVSSSSPSTAFTSGNPTLSQISNSELMTFIASSTAEANAAQAAIQTEINPVITQAQNALGYVAPTQALVNKIETVDTTDPSTLGTDTQTLAGMPPLASDVANAQQNAQAFGGATSTPANTVSLTVSGSTLVDQMNLISTNANSATLRAVCTLPASLGG